MVYFDTPLKIHVFFFILLMSDTDASVDVSMTLDAKRAACIEPFFFFFFVNKKVMSIAL